MAGSSPGVPVGRRSGNPRRSWPQLIVQALGRLAEKDFGEMKIGRAEHLPLDDLAPLIEESEASGWRHLRRLRNEWIEGVNRFDKPGEVMLLGWKSGSLVGVGGVNIDPYSGDIAIGRVRRVYVRATQRRTGCGRALVEGLVAHAEQYFQELQLRAGSAQAASFFEAIGFARATGQGDDDFTHRLLLPR